MLSETFPNVGHFWAHNSGGRVSMAGSDAFGWYTLPHPQSYYVRAGELYADDWKLAQDCMAAADADVHFPDFEGINIQTNGAVARTLATPARCPRPATA
jgi:hypothetical protein